MNRSRCLALTVAALLVSAGSGLTSGAMAANTNGQLTCNYSGGPGYGSSYDRPSQDRYYGYPRYYGYGR